MRSTSTTKGIRFWHPEGALNAIAIETDVHPGFMTDWQQPLVVALTQTTGLSIVHETVYENRLGFTEALQHSGARIQTYRECLGGSPCQFRARQHPALGRDLGPTPLRASSTVPGLRGGFKYVIAALAARGRSRVHGIDIINRGYEHSDETEALGAAAKARVTPATAVWMVSPGPMPTTHTRVAARPASSKPMLTRCPTRR